MKKVLLFIFFLPIFTLAQNQQKIDSLHKVINTSMDKTAVSNAYYDMALRYYAKKDSIKKYAFKNLEFTQENRLIEAEANAQNMLGIYYMRIRDLANAEKSQLKSIELFKKLNDTIKTKIGRSYGGLGTIYRVKGKPKKALYYLRTSAEILKRNNDEENLLKTYGRMGNLYDELGQYKNAENAFRRCEELLERGNYNDRFHFNVKVSVGLALMNQGEYVDAEKYFEECLLITERCVCNDAKGEIFENFGNLKSKTGDFPEALNNYLKSEEIYRTIEDVESQERIKNEIGTLYLSKGNTEKAKEYFQDALGIARKLNFQTGILNNESKLVEVFIKDSLYDKALTLNKKILVESKKIENVEFQIRSLRSSGKIYQEHIKDYPKAIEFFKKGIYLAEKHNNKEAVIQANLDRGKTYLLMKNYKQAEHFCFVAYELSERSKSLVKQKEACECMYQRAEAINDNEDSLKWLKKYNEIQGEIENIEKEEIFKEIETKYEVSEKEKEINELISEKSSLKNQLFGFIPLTIGTILLALVVFLLYKRSRNKVEILEIEKEKTTKKMEELKNIVTKDYIELKDKTKVYIDNLIYLKSDDHYLNVFLKDGKNHFVRGTLTKIADELPPNFKRCHRSYIVNTNFIKQVNSTTIVLTNKVKIPLSRTYKKNF